MDRYVVIGNPVSHSKSPQIHTQFAEQTGQKIDYSTLQADIGKFPAAAQEFFAGGGKGANVTVPFKEDAFNLAEELSPQAQLAGAVNTLCLNDEDRLVGHNTDGIGLVTDLLKNHGGILKDKRILVLGAGGATRGILAPLLAEKPALITIANRTVNKAEALAEIFHDKGVEISGCGFVALGGQKFDWIINATSASLQGEVPAVSAFLLTANTWCYDLAYGKGPTPFCRWAKEAGAEKSLDGLGMLVEQAAESFLLWRGIRPETSEVIKHLKKA